MKEPTFYRNLGAVLLVGDLVLTGLVFLKPIPVDMWVVIALSFGFVGGLSLLRPALMKPVIQYVASKLPTKSE